MSAFANINPALIDYVLPVNEQGYPDAVAAGDTRDVLWDVCGAASRKFPKQFWIEPKQWAEHARKNDELHTWGKNYRDRFTNQQPTHECTCHSEDTNFSVARNKQRGIIFKDGPVKGRRYPESARGSVFGSPMSIYNEANPGVWGGAGVRQVLEIRCRRGGLPDKIQPFDYGFKHTMPGTMGKGNSNQSHGDWVSYRNMPEGWEETAKWFRAIEVVFPDSWEEAVCLLLNGFAVSVGRNGHAVPWCELIFKGDSLQYAGYPDSYDVTRYDSLRTIQSAWRGSFSIISVTAPDDWMKPAGN